ncbi:MAG: hypothetical protein ACHQII_05280 [Bacteroidia bacterium]
MQYILTVEAVPTANGVAFSIVKSEISGSSARAPLEPDLLHPIGNTSASRNTVNAFLKSFFIKIIFYHGKNK